MTRQDLHHKGSFSNHETPTTRMAARNLRVLESRKLKGGLSSLKLTTVLKLLAAFLVGFLLVGLYQSTQQCYAKLGSDHILCVD